MNKPHQSKAKGKQVRRSQKLKGRNSPISKSSIEAKRKQAESLNLRLQGLGLQAIADVLGYSDASGAYRAIQAALKATIQEPADELRQQQAMKLQALYSKALTKDDLTVCLKVLTREAKLHGLDAPEQLRVEHQVNWQSMSDDEVIAAVIESLLTTPARTEVLMKEMQDRGYKVVAPKLCVI